MKEEDKTLAWIIVLILTLIILIVLLWWLFPQLEYIVDLSKLRAFF